MQTPSPRKLARMNARQRKKMHLGEFQELVFEVQIFFKQALSNEAFEDFLRAFVAYVESRQLFVGALGGQIPEEKTEGIIFASGRSSPSEEDRLAVNTWLQQHTDVEQASCSELTDAWYGWTSSV